MLGPKKLPNTFTYLPEHARDQSKAAFTPRAARPASVGTLAQYQASLPDNEPHHVIVYDPKAG